MLFELCNRTYCTNFHMGIGLSESHHIVHEGSRLLLEFTEAPLAETNDGVGHAVDVSARVHVQSELSSHISAHGEVLESLATAIAIFGPDNLRNA